LAEFTGKASRMNYELFVLKEEILTGTNALEIGERYE